MTAMYEGQETLAMGRAARELGLKTGEFELAVQLDEVSTVPPGPGSVAGRRRVPATEIARLREEGGFPDTLRERIRVVGATEGAELMGIAPGRFLRLARAGCFGPVRFYVNRYGAIVWQYLATELASFAGKECGLIHGPTPPPMRALLTSGQDWRGRLWRSRRVAQLVTAADGSWAVSAAIAAVLPPEELASLVRDPAERIWLRKLRPCLSSANANTPRTREAVERAETAEEFDEVMWYRISLSRQLDAARQEHPAPALRPSEAVMHFGAPPPGEAEAVPEAGKAAGGRTKPGKRDGAAGPRAADQAATGNAETSGTDGIDDRRGALSVSSACEVSSPPGAPRTPGPSGAPGAPSAPTTAAVPTASAGPSPRARLTRARTAAGPASRTRPRPAATGGAPARHGVFLTRRARGSAGRTRPQSPSFRKSPSWTTETSSLPSRS
ncbi:DUF6397 family protein [Streptomyces sp. Ru73]|uniref:DUF6397 family protein n=1 Tax=Streptomyces sp. Ru73 TaxID=2080748 RepID=UPI0011B0BEB6|nr:DUF6397 family protein [Streptomyces sp. Ru73]